MVETKHVIFDETWYTHQKKETYVSLVELEQNIENVTPARSDMNLAHACSEELSVSANTYELEEANEDPKEIGDLAKRAEVEEGMTSVGAGGNSDTLSKENSVEPRYAKREHRVPARFTTSTPKSIRHEDKLMTKEAVTGPETKNWKLVIETELRRLSGMSCWTVIGRPLKEKMIHSRFVLRRKQDKQGEIHKRKNNLSCVVMSNMIIKKNASHRLRFLQT